MKKIVVIGSGGAGLVAAISAKMAGAEVLVISKTDPGLATCTAYSAGLFSLACGGVSSEEHFQKTLRTGMGINDSLLLHTLTEEAEKTLLLLKQLGVTITLSNGRASARATAPNELMGGAGMQKELVSIAKKLGVRFENWSVVTSLAIEKGKTSGVRFENWRTGKKSIIPARAVIIASGGGGQIYCHTDNPARITGDSYALALGARLPLRDMEFVQFYPIGWNDANFPKWMADIAIVDYMRITDADGDEFLKRAITAWGYKDGREANLYARDRCSVLIEEKSRSGGVFAHLEDIEETMLNDPRVKYCLTINKDFFKGNMRPIRVTPLEHYFCGGIQIDTFGRTQAKGLYACGEATGGTDGANRVGGNALANIVTFGYRAGKTAAEECMQEQAFPNAEMGAEIGRVTTAGEPPETLRKELQEHAWAAIGPIRRASEMTDFLTYLDEFEKRPVKADTAYQNLLALEMNGLVKTARAVTEAALKRKESLGVHFRADAEK